MTGELLHCWSCKRDHVAEWREDDEGTRFVLCSECCPPGNRLGTYPVAVSGELRELRSAAGSIDGGGTGGRVAEKGADMPRQIVQQPDGLFCLWSTVVDDFIATDATEAEVVEFFAKDAADYARARTRLKLEAVKQGRAQDIYHQFAMSYEKCLEERHEEMKRGKMHGLTWLPRRGLTWLG